MSSKIIFLICGFLTENACSASTYDQRQTGDLNVQVDLKDLRIIAMMKGSKEEYVDYDYAYDYSEMTIKPQNGTTPKPLNGTSTVFDTIQNNSTAATVVTEPTILDIKNNRSQTLDSAEVSLSPINDSSTTVKTFEMITSITTEVSEPLSTKYVVSSTSTMHTTPSICKKGFIVNQKGDCELKLQGAGNALLKLVKLSQKLKLRRENRRNESDSA